MEIVEAIAQALGTLGYRTPTPLVCGDGRFPIAKLSQIVDDAARKLGRCCLAVDLVSQLVVGTLGIVDVFGYCRATHRESLEAVTALFPMICSAAKLEIIEDKSDDTVAVVLHRAPRAQISRHLAELALLLAVDRARTVAGGGCTPIVVELKDAAPVDPEPLATALGCRVRFERSHDLIRWPREVTERTSRTAMPALWPVLDGLLAQSSPASTAHGHTEKNTSLRIAMRAAVRAGRPTMAYVASQLGRSRRTLQRELLAEDIRFRALLSEEQARFAKELVEKSDFALPEIASRLGYADTRSFRRAYRRWHGYSPGAGRSRR